MSKQVGQFVLGMAVCLAAAEVPARAADVILNEWNAVANNKYLAGGDYSDALSPIKQDTHFASLASPPLPDGRIEGNGGNWFELVVVRDGLNIQGWKLKWAETNATNTDGTDPWYGSSTVEQGIITFSPTAGIWANLRSGTIITISEKSAIYVDTHFTGADRNFTDGLGAGDPEVDCVIDLSTDPSYKPNKYAADQDWWIHVSTRQEAGKAQPLVTTVTNVNGDHPGDFAIGSDDWQLKIFDAQGNVVHGPIGEAITTFGDFPGGIDDKEGGRLQADPDQAVINNNDYDDVTTTSFGEPNEWGGITQEFSRLRTAPEPTTLALLMLGAAGLLVRWRRWRR